MLMGLSWTLSHCINQQGGNQRMHTVFNIGNSQCWGWQACQDRQTFLHKQDCRGCRMQSAIMGSWVTAGYNALSSTSGVTDPTCCISFECQAHSVKYRCLVLNAG